MAQEAIWPGSGSAASGSTPFGLYDTDSEFQTENMGFLKRLLPRKYREVEQGFVEFSSSLH